MSTSASRPVSLVASILLNPASRDKRVKGFKKQLPPLPWYTAQQAESVAREQRLAREDRGPDASSDMLLQRLKQKDMKMKRTLSQFLSEDDTELFTDAKKSKTTQTSSPEPLTPSPLSPSPPRTTPRELSPPPEAETRSDAPTPEESASSGRYRLDDDSDIDPREYELIITEAKLNRSSYSDDFTDLDLQTTDSAVSEKDSIPERADQSLAKPGVSEARERTGVNVPKKSVSNGKDEGRSERTTDSSASLTLTEEELEEVTRHQFMLSYHSMCHVLGVSTEEGDKVLKSWQDSKDKPSGILKTPTEKFGTRSDSTVSDSLPPPQEKAVSFCLPEQQESASPPVPATTSPPELEPKTSILAPAPPQGALMSTPRLSASTPRTGALAPAAPSNLPPLPQDISIIPSATSQPKDSHLSSTLALSIPAQAGTPLLPTTARSEAVPPATQSQHQPSLLSSLTSNPTRNDLPQPALTSSLNPTLAPRAENQSSSPFAFLSQVKPATTTTQPQPLLSSQTTSTQSGNSLFKVPNPSSQPQESNSRPLFQPTSTPIQRGPTPQPPQNIFKVQTPSFFNKPQDKPVKPFHNLEISHSIPPNSAPLFTPLPATQTTQPFSAPTESPVPNLCKRQHATAFSIPESSSSSLQPGAGDAAIPKNSFNFKPNAASQGGTFAPNVPFSFNFGQSTAQNPLFQVGGATPPHFEGGATFQSGSQRRIPPKYPPGKKKRK